MRAITAVCTVAVMLVPSLASAQPRPTGLWLNAHLNGSSFQAIDLPDTETGGGMGLGFGWAFTRGVMLFMQVDGASMAGGGGGLDYTLGHADIGFRMSAGLGSFSPYLLVAGSTRVATWNDVPLEGPLGPIYYDVTARGIGGSVGAGLQKMMSRKLALDGALIYTKGTFTDGTVDGRDVDFENYDAESTRFVLGLSWYPRGS